MKNLHNLYNTKSKSKKEYKDGHAAYRKFVRITNQIKQLKRNQKHNSCISSHEDLSIESVFNRMACEFNYDQTDSNNANNIVTVGENVVQDDSHFSQVLVNSAFQNDSSNNDSEMDIDDNSRINHDEDTEMADVEGINHEELRCCDNCKRHQSNYLLETYSEDSPYHLSLSHVSIDDI